MFRTYKARTPSSVISGCLFVLFCFVFVFVYLTLNPGPYTYSGNLFSLCWILNTDGWKFVKQMLSPLMNLYIFLEKFAEITRVVVKIHSLELKGGKVT